MVNWALQDKWKVEQGVRRWQGGWKKHLGWQSWLVIPLLIAGCQDVTAPSEELVMLPNAVGNRWEYRLLSAAGDSLALEKMEMEVVGKRRFGNKQVSVVRFRWYEDGKVEMEDTVQFWQQQFQLWQYWMTDTLLFLRWGVNGWMTAPNWLPLADFGLPAWSYRSVMPEGKRTTLEYVDSRGEVIEIVPLVADSLVYGARFEGKEDIPLQDTTVEAYRYRCGFWIPLTQYGPTGQVYEGCARLRLVLWFARNIGIVQFAMAAKGEINLEFGGSEPPCEVPSLLTWRLHRYNVR